MFSIASVVFLVSLDWLLSSPWTLSSTCGKGVEQRDPFSSRARVQSLCRARGRESSGTGLDWLVIWQHTNFKHKKIRPTLIGFTLCDWFNQALRTRLGRNLPRPTRIWLLKVFLGSVCHSHSCKLVIHNSLILVYDAQFKSALLAKTNYTEQHPVWGNPHSYTIFICIFSLELYWHFISFHIDKILNLKVERTTIRATFDFFYIYEKLSIKSRVNRWEGKHTQQTAAGSNL